MPDRVCWFMLQLMIFIAFVFWQEYVFLPIVIIVCYNIVALPDGAICVMLYEIVSIKKMLRIYAGYN